MERREESVICLIYTSDGRRERGRTMKKKISSCRSQQRVSKENTKSRLRLTHCERRQVDRERGHRLREMKPWAELISWPVIDPSIKRQ
ncbi:LOW QUALITY PROTEIN: hypothetical protein TorRG33x02_220580 [Trema orientale]|uniref:Uncharacterized protein n=1 Tax=Trema orientale TaxID=63057 RepID=A0A2P5E9C9_TREOI|nr:LOW QUALITY PROTEIN: hypothetical protein TorRG33x02_220580 [Trema orientale]